MMATRNTAMAKTNDESQIRHLIEDWCEALRTRDLDRLTRHYAPDVLFVDAVPPPTTLLGTPTRHRDIRSEPPPRPRRHSLANTAVASGKAGAR
jgi:SnoaL-like protein